MLTWFVPSFYGDIKLEARDKKTLVTYYQLTSEEQTAMRALFSRATSSAWTKQPWAKQDDLDNLDLHSTTKVDFFLNAPIDKVQKVLVKALKPLRETLSAVKIGNGRIEELHESTVGLIEAKAEAEPVRATTVAVPDRGCPVPEFEQAEVRASAVLEAFLSPIQLHDFREHQAFVVTGYDTGRRYQVTSRHARGEIARVQRSLYDLDDRRPLCVHDWNVPAAEEMLAILVCLSLPGREKYLRILPE